MSAPSPAPLPPAAAVPTLTSLCLDAVSTKIERYPPKALGLLSETEWDIVVKQRHRKTAPRQLHCPPNGGGGGSNSSAPSAIRSGEGGLDGSGRSVPAIPEKALSAIEEANPHLAKSDGVDRLVWKDCVEYKFKTGGASRPRVFQYPWPILVDRVKKSSDDLLGLLAPPSNDETTTQMQHHRARSLDRSIQMLYESPMSVPLLTASGVGKSVKKFIKGCSKLCPTGANPTECDIPYYVPDVWTPRPCGLGGHLQLGGALGRPRNKSESPLSRLERLLDGWKVVASSSGVAVTSKAESAPSEEQEDFSGRGRKTTAEQHAEDVSRSQTCQQWRDVYAALAEREAKLIASHGAKMKKLREDLERDKHKIGKVNVQSRNKRATQDAILSGSRGGRAMAAAASSGSSFASPPSKMQQLRRQVAEKTSRQMPVGSGAPRARTAPPMRKAVAKPVHASFGASVAAANSTSSRTSSTRCVKRKGIVGSVGKRDVVLSGGKKMALPKKMGGTGVFSSIAQKKQKAAAMEAFREKQRKLEEKRRYENDPTPRYKR